MKKLFNAFGTIAVVAVFILSFAACDDIFGGKKPTEYEPKHYHCSNTTDGTDYILTITRTDKAAVQFTPAAGDSYLLTITTKAGDPKKSTGTVKSFSNNKFTLQPSSAASATIDVTVDGIQITSITSTSQTIPLDGGGTVQTPGTLNPANAFVAVTDITGVPASGAVGTLTLNGTVEPANATNKTIVWTVGTGAAISGNVLTTTTTGTVTVTATITNGKTPTTNYTKDFTITIIPTFSTVEGNLGFKKWLDDQDDNKAAEPYAVALNFNDVEFNKLYMALDNMYYETVNPKKYVSLDFSGSTFTKIESLTTFSFPTVTGVTIGNSVTKISPVFYNCKSLTAINVAQGNSKYTSEGGVLYNKDKTTLICYPSAKTGSTFTIPDGVTEIEYNAFYGCTGLTGVTIPNSVTSIGDNAFYNCSKLTGVTIPSGVTEIGYAAFSNCGSLTAITVAQGNSEYTSEDGVLFNMGQTTLICYPPAKTGSTFTIRNSVNRIDYLAFSGCTGLTSITIGKGLTSEYSIQFLYECTGLTAIDVAPDHSSFTSEGGVLYNKGKNKLIRYPMGKTGSFTIPAGVTQISEGAFGNCKLASVTIPDNVIYIFDYAFYNCLELTSVTFEGDIIGDNFEQNSFLGDLRTKYLTPEPDGGIGTYKTTKPVSYESVWTKEP